MWTPVLGQTLLVKREPTNSKDKNAVAVYLEDVVVGQLTIPRHDFHIFCYGFFYVRIILWAGFYWPLMEPDYSNA